MTVPLMILAVFAIFFGFVGSPLFHGAFQAFIAGPGEEYGNLNIPLAFVSTGIGLLGIAIAWGYYGAHWFSAAATTRAFRPIHTLLIRKYYVDDAYDWLSSKALIGLSNGFYWFDRHIVDGVVNGLAWVAYTLFGWVLTRAESGRLPNYAFVFFLGVVIIAGVVVGIPTMR